MGIVPRFRFHKRGLSRQILVVTHALAIEYQCVAPSSLFILIQEIRNCSNLIHVIWMYVVVTIRPSIFIARWRVIFQFSIQL